jgi:hypothetical protein
MNSPGRGRGLRRDPLLEHFITLETTKHGRVRAFRRNEAVSLLLVIALAFILVIVFARLVWGQPLSIEDDGSVVTILSSGRNTSSIRSVIGVAIGGEPHCGWIYHRDGDGVQHETEVCNEGEEVEPDATEPEDDDWQDDVSIFGGWGGGLAGVLNRSAALIRRAESEPSGRSARAEMSTLGPASDDGKPGNGDGNPPPGGGYCPSKSGVDGGTIAVTRSGSLVRITVTVASFPGVVSIHTYTKDGASIHPPYPWEALHLAGTSQTKTVTLGCPPRCCATASWMRPGRQAVHLQREVR